MENFTKETAGKVLMGLAVLFLLLGVIWGILGFNKLTVYENSEYYWEDNQNAYVGGDAYNYIINGTYFSGYSSLSGAMIISATVSFVAGLSFLFQGKKEKKEENAQLTDMGKSTDEVESMSEASSEIQTDGNMTDEKVEEESEGGTTEKCLSE